MSETLPKGWTFADLSECVKILDSKRVPINAKERELRIAGKKSNELIPYYGATGMVGYIDDFLFDQELLLLGEDGVPFYDPFKKKAYIIDGKSWVNNHAHVLDAISGLTTNGFLRHFLTQFDYNGFVTGTTRLKLNQAKMKTIPVRLPPLPEQSRITAKLDYLLARVVACKKRLDKVPEIIRRFRQSVLADAVSGKLTEDWREGITNIESSKRLIDKIKRARRIHWETKKLDEFRLTGKEPKNKNWKEKYKEPEKISFDNLFSIPQSWKWLTVDELSTKVVDGVHKKPNYVAKGVPFITVKNLTACPEISFEDTKFITYEDHLTYIKRAHPENGDILVSKDGTLGVIRLITTKKEFSIFVSVALIKPVFERISKYLSYILQAPQIQNEMVATGTGLQHIHLRDLRKVPIPLPSIEEQDEIISRIEALFSIADSFEEKHASAQKRVVNLTASILSKAFRGELVPQDPTDEPAELLLKRIRSERESLAANKKKGGRTPKNRSGRGKKLKLQKADAEVEPEPAVEVPVETVVGKEKDKEIVFRKQAGYQNDKRFDKTDVLKAFRNAIFHQSELDEHTLLRLVGQRLGVNRLSKEIRHELESHIRTAIRRKIIIRNGNGYDSATPTINHYDEEYLVQVQRSVLRKGYEYQREHVVELAANFLGYDKVSEVFKQRMKTIFRLAIRRGELYRNGIYVGRA